MRVLPFLFILLASMISTTVRADATVGEPAPPFAATDSHGTEHSLADFKGKTVVLEWFNNQCPFVAKHYESGNMQKLQQKYTENDVIWLTINSSAPGKQGYVTGEEANELISEHASAQTAFLLDPEGTVGQKYGARTTPHMFVIDAGGTLRYAGAIDSNSSSRPETVANATNYVAGALDSLQADTPVDPTATEPYGCSVKYAS